MELEDINESLYEMMMQVSGGILSKEDVAHMLESLAMKEFYHRLHCPRSEDDEQRCLGFVFLSVVSVVAFFNCHNISYEQ